MSYATQGALRAALEQRLLNQSRDTGVSLDRLRRRVIFERLMARLEAAEPGNWVVKGGMALEVRLHDRARLTKDLDLGLRDSGLDSDQLHDRLIEALTADQLADAFVLEPAAPTPLQEDNQGLPTWRLRVSASMANKSFGSIQLDVSPRPYELLATDRVELTNSLDFANVAPVLVEIVDVHRHAAEKFHGMTRDFGDRENSRVRDLVDLVLLSEHGLLTPSAVASAAAQVWAERDRVAPPDALPILPASWSMRYERLATEHKLDADTFESAAALVDQLWRSMFADGAT